VKGGANTLAYYYTLIGPCTLQLLKFRIVNKQECLSLTVTFTQVIYLRGVIDRDKHSSNKLHTWSVCHRHIFSGLSNIFRQEPTHKVAYRNVLYTSSRAMALISNIELYRKILSGDKHSSLSLYSVSDEEILHNIDTP
jgi:hypothetical protein